MFVPDDDIIKQSNINKSEAQNGEFILIVKYLFEENNRMIMCYLEFLPSKAKKLFQPHVIWIIPPQHKYFANNEVREYFATALEVEVTRYSYMCMLRVKKTWDEMDGNLYLRGQCRYTPQGLHDYWLAIDQAIKFWDRTLREIMIKRQRKSLFHMTPVIPQQPTHQREILNRFHTIKKGRFSQKLQKKKHQWQYNTPERLVAENYLHLYLYESTIASRLQTFFCIVIYSLIFVIHCNNCSQFLYTYCLLTLLLSLCHFPVFHLELYHGKSMAL